VRRRKVCPHENRSVELDHAPSSWARETLKEDKTRTTMEMSAMERMVEECNGAQAKPTERAWEEKNLFRKSLGSSLVGAEYRSN
jgi:hypothetical protein